MTELRKDRRAPASLKVKYKSATVDEFIEHFGTDVSRGGIFIKTKKPLDTGALLKFEFQLHDGSPVIHGVGRVAWRRSEQNAKPEAPAGMGIKFIKLDEASRAIVERIAAAHGKKVSRFDQTDGAEHAPPLSSGPPPPEPELAAAAPARQSVPTRASTPAVAPKASVTQQAAPAPRPTSNNSPPLRRATPQPMPRVQPPAAGSAPLSVPPPPARNSTPPPVSDALAELFAETPARGSAPTPSPIPQPAAGRISAPGSAPSLPRPPSPTPASAAKLPKGMIGSFFDDEPKTAAKSAKSARDTSEFLASAFSAGGAGQAVRAEARAQVEEARRSEAPPGLGHELFGDRGTPAPAPEPPLQPLGDPEELAGLRRSSEPKVPSLRELSLGEEIPSLDELADEAKSLETGIAGALEGEGLNGGDEEDLFGEAELGAAAVAPLQPLAAAPPAQKKSSAGLYVGILIALAAALGGVYFFVLQPGGSAAPTEAAPEPAAAPELVQPTAAAPTQPTPAPAEPAAPAPAAAAEPTQPSQPTAAEPARAAPAAAEPAKPAAEPAKPAEAPAAAPAQPAGPGTPAAAQPTAAEPAPAQPPVPVNVNVTSWPSPAEVSIDGKPSGNTPTNLALPTGRAIAIAVHSPGYATLTKTVTPTASMDPVRFKLEPISYVLVLTTDPPGAMLTVKNSSAVSPAPLDLGHLEGQVNVSIEKEGYQRMSRVLRLDEFRERDNAMRAEVSMRLTALPHAEKKDVLRLRKKLAPSAGAAPATASQPAPKPAAAPQPEDKPKPAEKPAPKPAAALPDNPF